MSEKTYTVSLSPDYCCGGGHCGPLPGYYFTCPSCEEESSCRTGDYLREGEFLQCFLCKVEMKAVEKLSLFEFKFSLV